MITPFGSLDTIDLFDPQRQEEVILAEKTALIQGLVVERLVDQIIETLFEQTKGEVEEIPVEAVIGYHGKGKVAFVEFSHGESAKLASILCNEMTVVPFRYDEHAKDFFTSASAFGKGSKTIQQTPDMNIPLQQWVAARLELDRKGMISQFPKVAENVKNTLEQKRMFWGFLRGLYDEQALVKKILLPRILKNFAFPGLKIVDLDRIIRFQDKLIVLEVKHKFPFGSSKDLKFGLNTGQADVAQTIAQAGLRYFHMILVNPIWERDISPKYLFVDFRLRERVSLIGCEILANSRQKHGTSATAPSRTSFDGRKKQSFDLIPLEKFSFIGDLRRPIADVAKGMFQWLNGNGSPASPNVLLSYRER
ncbi:MAG: hypothetical protein D6816_18665 [Bacteroidetes bacterium]|nr:MAG: hypothetical protein D6816_18665 [Bacteroidota bacterium]